MAMNNIVGKAMNEEGWRTTDKGHKIHIDKDGNVDKGNPHVLAKIRSASDDDKLDRRLMRMRMKRVKEKMRKKKEDQYKRQQDEAVKRQSLVHKWLSGDKSALGKLFYEEQRAKRKNDWLAKIRKKRADMMKANIARLMKNSLENERSVNMETKSKVVANALNAVRNGSVKLYAKSGGTATVYEGDKVEYDGRVYTAKALGSPSMDSATLVDDAGNKLVVKMKDYKLKAVNAAGEGKNYYVVDEFGNVADGSTTPLPFDRASALFLKLTGSKSGNGKWGIIRKGEPASKARDWYGNIVSWNADTSVVTEKAVNAGDATTRKFKPNDLVEWNDYKGRHNSAYYFRDNGPNRVTVSIYRDGQGGFLEVPRAWLINSRVRNASSSPFGFFVGEQVVIKKDPSKKKYRIKEITETGDIRLEGATPLFDASELDTANYAGEYRARNAKFKAGDKAYVHWFSGEDELVDVISYEPKGDYYIVRGEDGQLAHPKASLLYPVKNASALNAVRVGMKDTNGRDISIGDSIQHIDSKMKGKVVGKFNEYLLLVDWDGGFQEEVHPSDIRITNSRVVANALNATALNYSPYGKGGWLHDDKGANYTVVEEEHWGKNGGAERFVTIRDERTKQTKEVPVTELDHRFHVGEAEACAKCGNAIVSNSLNARNDKWIDDFHVIETKGTPDKELVDALKKKASAWKVAKRNFSDAAAASAHDKAEAEAMAIAKRLGARWVQQGAVLRVVMPN